MRSVLVVLVCCLLWTTHTGALRGRSRIEVSESDGAFLELLSQPETNANTDSVQAEDAEFTEEVEEVSEESAETDSSTPTHESAELGPTHPAHRQRFAAPNTVHSNSTSTPKKSTTPTDPAISAAIKAATKPPTVVKGYKMATKGFEPPCDLVATQGLCLFGGQKVVIPDATAKGLVAWFKFDEMHPIDASRFNNHGVAVVPHGMGRGGLGSSGRFDGDSWLEVVSSLSLATMLNHSSVSFWAFFGRSSERPVNHDCSIIHLGSEEESVLDIAYNAASRRVTASRVRNWVTVRSRARPGRGQWHHFAITADRRSLRLYVNGILDAQADVPPELSGARVLNKPIFQFFAGGLPWANANKCRLQLLIDDLKLFNRPLRRDEIEAESFPSLGVTEPAFVRFGCEKCVFDDARKSCPTGYHLCYKPELMSGALSVGRKMGWLSASAPIWENDITDTNFEHKGPPGEMRAAYCCAE